MDHSSTIFPQTYSEWDRTALGDWPRRFARSAALSALYLRARATGALNEGLATPRVQFFCLHHMFRDEERPFRRVLSRLSKHFEFVSWSEGVRMVLEGHRPSRPIACFSSDDGLVSNLAMARILEEFGTTACFFLNPVTLGSDDAFAARFCRTRLQAPPSHFLSHADVEGLLRRGHEIGNHTMTHVVCSETPLPRLVDEISIAKEFLESRFGEILHFAWPYGQYHQFSEAARVLVFESGHVSASSVVRGAHLVTNGPKFEGDLCLRRDQLWATDPVEHILYFTARNALAASASANAFPKLVDGWERLGTPGPESCDTNGQRVPSGLEPWDAIPFPASKTSERRPDQYAPSPSRAARTVRKRIARSNQIDQLRT